MNLALLIYAINVISNITAVATATFFSVIVIFIISLIATDGDLLTCKKATKWFGIIFGISLSLCIFLPDKKEMYIMVGAYAAEQVATNPEVKRLSGKVLDVIESNLDKYVEEAKNAAIKKATK